MEKALALTPLALRGLRRMPAGFGALYLGSDSCRHLLPTQDEVRRAIGLGPGVLVLAAPILTDEGIRRFSALAGLALKLAPRSEASLNDIGALSALAKEYRGALGLSMGRQLSSVFLKMSRPFLRGLKERLGLVLFETDDPETASGLAREGEFPAAFHTPYRLFSVTRVCPYHAEVPAACGRLCGDRPLVLDGGKLTLRNSSYLSPCGAMPSPPPARLIVTPGLPSGQKSPRHPRRSR